MTVGRLKGRAVGGLVVVVLLAGCAGSGSTGAAPAPSLSGPSNAYLQPEPGEKHLRNIRQLTFGGNNAESYFSLNFRCEVTGSGDTPSTTAPSFCTDFQLSRNSQASVVQPLVSSFG